MLIASLTGSAHCAGMCGGFVAFYSGDSTSSGRWIRHLGYHAGRLITYAVTGAVAGLLGQGITWIGDLAGIQHVLIWVLGLAMILWGVRNLFNLRFSLPLPQKLSGLHVRVLKPLFDRIRASRSSHPATLAFGMGLLSTFLPCGWLYLNVMAAGATGSAAGGAMLMAVFWLGTVPILLLFGEATGFMSNKLRIVLPRVTACLLIAAGLYALTTHYQAFNAQKHRKHHCCD